MFNHNEEPGLERESYHPQTTREPEIPGPDEGAPLLRRKDLLPPHLHILRAERAALERTQREVEAMTKKNEENERALASFAKWGADSVREGESSLHEIDRVTTEMAETLGKMSEEHARDTFKTRSREARETGRAQAEAFVKKNVMDKTKG